MNNYGLPQIFKQGLGWLVGKDFYPAEETSAGTPFVGRYRTEQTATDDSLIQAYRNIIYACANLNANAVASVPVKLYVETGKGQTRPKCLTQSVTAKQRSWLLSNKSLSARLTKAVEIEEVLEHPLLTLLYKVNEYLDLYNLLALTALYQEIHGSAYWHLPKNGLGIPEAIWLLQSQRVTPKATGADIVSYYNYGKGMSPQRIEAEDMIVFRYPSLNDPYRQGWSPTRAAWESVGLLQKSRSLASGFLDNNARADFLLTTKGDEAPGRAEAERMERQLERKYKFGGRGGISILSDSFDVKRLNIVPRDLQMLAFYEMAKIEIANVFDVPMSLLTTKDVNRANAEAGHFQHAKLSILPRLRRRDEVLTRHLCSLYDERLFIASDNPVPEDESRKAIIRGMNLDHGYTSINEERLEDGQEPVEWGDKPWLPMTLVQVGSPTFIPGQFQGMKDENLSYEHVPFKKDFIAQVDFQDAGRMKPRAFPAEGCSCTHTKETLNTYNLPRGRDIAEFLRTTFEQQRTLIMNALKSAGGLLAETKRWPDSWKPIDLTEWDVRMQEASAVFLAVYYDRAGKQLLERVAVTTEAAEWSVNSPEIRTAIDKAAFKFCHATNETTSLHITDALAKLRHDLAEGIIESENTVQELTKRVNAIFDHAEVYRAKRIAVTESSRAVHEGQALAAEKSGVVRGFKWLLSADACEFCQAIAAANPDGIPLGGSFGKFGNHPDYSNVQYPPLHPNCFCTITEILTED